MPDTEAATTPPPEDDAPGGPATPESAAAHAPEPLSAAEAPPPPEAPVAVIAADPAVAAAAPPTLPPPLPGSELAPPAPPRRRMSRAALIWIIALGVLVLAAAGVLVYLLLQLLAAQELIDDQQQEITDLNELVDEKQEFGAAMQQLMDTARGFDGAPMAVLVPFASYDQLAQQAWLDRRSPSLVAEHAARAAEYTTTLEELLGRAEAERSSNSSGTVSERVVDSVGQGFATLVYDNADSICEEDVLGCVIGSDPYVIHLDKRDMAHPSVDDWGRRYIALHEFAHVLQFTNPEVTAEAAEAFGDDWEFMADCYALNALDSRSLERRVWVSSYQYWDVSYGYGRVCNSGQREVIDDWVEQAGVHYRPVSQ